MRSDRVFESRSAVRVAIILISVGLHGCVPLMSPRNFGDWTIYRMPSQPARGFLIADYVGPPHHRVTFQFGGFLITCVARVNWDEDQSRKITSNLTIIYPCASF
jgi:hypothetical protein